MRSSFLKPLSVFILALFLSANVFAQEVVPTDPTAPTNPEIAYDETANTSNNETAAIESEADSFLEAGPLSAATVSAAAVPQNGRSLYVSNSGSDSNSGAQGSAFKTIAYAVSQLQAGDTLFIEEGTYTKVNVAFTKSGTADNYIRIVGLGNVVLDGVNRTNIVDNDGTVYSYASSFTPTFDTKGHDYISFENLTVKNSRDAVEVSPGSSYINIDGLVSDGNHFAVKINGGDHVTVRNAVVTNSRNGFRTEAAGGIVPSDLLFENIVVSGSKDVYSGFQGKYYNGDGFIFEGGNNITIRDVKSYDNWDGGFDIKATNVLVERVDTYGNKNNFKIWGTGITVKDSIIHDAKIKQNDPVAGEGFGVNNRMGQITFINTTFANNENADIRADNDGGPSSTTLQNSIIARTIASGNVYTHDGGSITDRNNIWYDSTASAHFTLDPSSRWADPKFVNAANRDYHLQAGSAAIDFGSSAYPASLIDFDEKTRTVGSKVDAGAYEYQTGSTPGDTIAPVISAVVSSGITQTGAAIAWTTNELSDSQVEYRAQGSSSWQSTAINASMLTAHAAVLSGLTADTTYEFRVKSKDAAGNLATQSTVSTFKTLASIIPNPNPTPTCSTAMCGVTAGQTVSGTIKVQPNLTQNPTIRKVSYYLNGTLSGREYAAPFTWGGTSGFDTTKLADGNYTLSGAYTTLSGDQNFSIAFTVKNSVVTPVDTVAPAISAVAVGSMTQTGATINWTTNEASDSQVEYRLAGATSWTAAPLNSAMVTNHTVTLSGLTAGSNYEFRVKSKDAAGNLATQATVSSFKTLDPAPAPVTSTLTLKTSANGTATAMTGTVDVSGTVFIAPNQNITGIRKVAYYIDGSLSNRQYSAPFTWGGTAGFDTTKLSNGTHTLAGAYTDATGDHNFTVTINVKNGVVVNPNPAPVTSPMTFKTSSTGTASAFVNNTTVSGTIFIAPNSQTSGVRKVAYYLNGTLYSREYSAPFTMGGTAGLDTKKLANGTYTLSGAYTTASGDVPFTITFTVQN